MSRRSSHFGYGALLIVGFILTTIGLFTPGWRSYKGEGAPDLGIVSRYCGRGNREVNEFDCREWHRHQLPFEKATLAFMIIAFIIEIICIMFFFGLFSKTLRLGAPTFSLTAFAFCCLFIAIIIYGVRMQHKVGYLQSTSYELLANVYHGYSYWISVAATCIMLLATLTASALIRPDNDNLHRN